jgi:hypothetical protein
MRDKALRWSAPAPSGASSRKYEIDRLIVQRLEIDRRFQSREDASDALHAGQLAVRNGDAVADTGGSQLFALQDRLENVALGNTRDSGCALGQKLEHLLLGAGLQRRQDCRNVDKIVQSHF